MFVFWWNKSHGHTVDWTQVQLTHPKVDRAATCPTLQLAPRPGTSVRPSTMKKDVKRKRGNLSAGVCTESRPPSLSPNPCVLLARPVLLLDAAALDCAVDPQPGSRPVPTSRCWSDIVGVPLLCGSARREPFPFTTTSQLDEQSQRSGSLSVCNPAVLRTLCGPVLLL